MKPNPRKPITYKLTNPDQPTIVNTPKDVPTQLFERTLDTMQVISTLYLRLEKSGLKLSPASQAKIQTVAGTILYIIDREAKSPHPLRDIPEIDDQLSLMIVGRND